MSRSPAAPPLTLNAWMRWDVIGPIVASAAPTSVLEFGPGAGAVAARLAAAADTYVGVEPDADNRALAGPRLGPDATLVGHLSEEDDRSFDLVAAFEVLEHLDDDRAHLRSWVERCRIGGLVVISVPAHAHRFGPHDTWAAHLRRYDRDPLRSLAESCGLADVRIDSVGGPLGYVLEWARNVLARRHLARRAADGGQDDARTGASARTRQPPAVLGRVTELGTFPFRLVQRPLRQTNMGTGFVVSGRRAS